MFNTLETDTISIFFRLIFRKTKEGANPYEHNFGGKTFLPENLTKCPNFT